MALEYTRLKGISDIRDDTVTAIMENNLVEWYNWGFLKIGAWTDVEIPTSGNYGDYSELRLVNDDSYQAGQVWEAVRKDWVWETGVNFVDGTGTYNPIAITGVQVNGVMYGTGDATYGHYYNYPLGRVIFDNPIDTDDVVKLSYSYRTIQVYKADDLDWWQYIQFNSLDQNDSQFAITNSGEFSIGGQHRVQMPALIIGTVPRGQNRPYEIGNGGMVLQQDVLLYAISQNKVWRDKLIDIALMQDDYTLWMFNSNTLAASGEYALDYRGMFVGTKMYPDLVSPIADGGYRWKRLRFENTRSVESQGIHRSLHEGVVRTTCEVIFDGI